MQGKICPSCIEKRGILWTEKIADKVILPVPHRAFTFTILKILRAYFRYDRKLLSKLSGCAYLSVKDHYQSVLDYEVTIPGFLAVGLSFGNTLNHHAHLPAIANQGIFKHDGTFLNCMKIETNAIKELFMSHTFTPFTSLPAKNSFKGGEAKCVMD